ncbi:MAG: hypothetical protein ACP5P3_08265 [Ignavibacteria bacterium]
MKKLTLLIIFTVLFGSKVHPQMFNDFAIFGGPMIGWHIPSVDELNRELGKLSIEEFPNAGYLTFGGGGYVDLPVIKGLRVGVFATGFSDEKNSPILPDKTINSAVFGFSYTSLSVEYTKRFLKKFEFSIGSTFGLGKTKLTIARMSSKLNSWNGFADTSDVFIGENKYSVKSFIIGPEFGVGFYPADYLLVRLTAGYILTVQGDWKLNDAITVTGVPSGIKGQGFTFGLSINGGLFFNKK